MSKPYKAVLFDLFGTLVDNFSVAEYRAILEEMSAILKTPPEDFRRLWSATFRDRCTGVHGDQRDSYRFICRELGIGVSKEQVEEAFRLRLAFTVRSLKPRPDTVNTLETIRVAGLKTALISDCSGEVPVAWPETPFAGLFDYTVFSCVAGALKPDTRLYREATTALGVEPEACVYVGDGNNRELTGARDLGMRAVLIRDPGEPPEVQVNTREDDWDGDRIACLSELLPLLGLVDPGQ